MRTLHFSFCLPLLLVLAPRSAFAQSADEPPRASPTLKVEGPTALVKGPAAPGDAPAIEGPANERLTSITLSSGGTWSSGNSKLLAGTLNGQGEYRVGANSVGAQLLGNYGRGAAAGEAMKTSAENVQGRVRYDRYLSERFTGFLMLTGRYDRFQGLDFRLNIDPGVKYIVAKDETYAIWGEMGYDLQHDIRRNSARYVLSKGADGKALSTDDGRPIVEADPNNPGVPLLRDKTYTDHAARLFIGYRHAFSKEVTAQTGLEYLQSFRDSDRYRVNFDALLAAKIVAGFSAGMGFTARFDNAPLDGKETLDTALVATLIYAFSNAKQPGPPPATCPCPEPPPPPPVTPESAPAPPAPPPAPATPPVDHAQ